MFGVFIHVLDVSSVHTQTQTKGPGCIVISVSGQTKGAVVRCSRNDVMGNR